jgi:Holliday junction resolvase RusA-like endonuclease
VKREHLKTIETRLENYRADRAKQKRRMDALWGIVALSQVSLIEFTVFGDAKPAGSKRSYVPLDKHGNPYRRPNGGVSVQTVDDNPKSKDWKQQVSAAAHQVYSGPLLTGPLRVTMTFVRVRPKGHYGTKGLNSKGRESIAPISKPDVLKLARGVEDACTGIVWKDDAQIVAELIVKEWGEPARCEVTIEPLTAASPQD